jgi:formylglycine-generating enzyme required for sulfatase activity
MVFLFSIISCARERAPEIEGMVFIPSGEFIMGSEEQDIEALGKEFGLRTGRLYDDEKPLRKVYLKGFYIDKYEVTNIQYKAFIDALTLPAPYGWEKRMYPDGRGDHPVVNVSWFDAHLYCTWAGKRLPTETEWEKAARGPGGNRYAWGNEYDEKKGNIGTHATAPVGSYKEDKSPYGVYDMAGNVMEWVDDWYGPYPGNTIPSKDYGEHYRVLRGGTAGIEGHYVLGSIFSRASARHYYIPTEGGDDAGFRCAKSLEDVR